MIETVEEKSAEVGEEILARWPGDELLERNLAGLREWDGELAERIAQTVLPGGAELAVAQDGSVSYRVRQEDGRRPWLGMCSTPMVAARANLKRIDLNSVNLIMDGVGHGGEIQLVLERMSPYQALFVTETDAAAIQMVLRLRDLAEPLRTGRLVILLGDQPLDLLDGFFTKHPGYNICERVATSFWVSDGENQQFAQQVTMAMERIAAGAFAETNTRLGARREEDGKTRQVQLQAILTEQRWGELKVANFTNTYARSVNTVTRDALAGLAVCGAATDRLILDGPDKVSHLAHLNRFDRFDPEMVLLVDDLRGDLPGLMPPGAACVSVMTRFEAGRFGAAAKPAERMGEGDLIAAVYEGDVEQFVEAGVAAERVMHLPWGANVDLFAPVEGEDAGDVLFIGERPSNRTDTYCIKLPTHQQMLQNAVTEIARGPERYHPHLAEQYVRRAQQGGLRVKDEKLQHYFADLLRYSFGPAAIVDSYLLALQRAGVDLSVYAWAGRASADGELPGFWSEAPVAEQVAGAAPEGAELNRVYNRAKLCVHLCPEGRADQHLLDAAAAGTLCLVRKHPHLHRSDGVGQFFEMDKDVVGFDSPRDLVRKVEHFLKNDEQRRAIAAAGRERVLRDHTMQQRMAGLLERLG